MKKLVVDSSVILTLLNKERGYEAVESLLPDAVMSSVNIAELAGVLIARHGLPLAEVGEMLDRLIADIILFVEPHPAA
jgi:ribonuclease VapC